MSHIFGCWDGDTGNALHTSSYCQNKQHSQFVRTELSVGFKFKHLKILFICACVCRQHGTAHVWSLKDNSRKSILTFHHVGPQTELGSPCLRASTFTHGNILPIHSFSLSSGERASWSQAVLEFTHSSVRRIKPEATWELGQQGATCLVPRMALDLKSLSPYPKSRMGPPESMQTD